jgi:branched-chain amino acid transport system ATP-binding protein
MSDVILEARGIGMRFGRFQALSGVTASFRDRELCAIIGPNGAGKSTFFNILSGSLAPTSGRVLFRGEDVTALPQHAYARLGIAKSFQITNVFKQLSAHENVRVAAQMRHVRFNFLKSREAWPEAAEEADALLERVGLAPWGRKPAGDLAHGQQWGSPPGAASRRATSRTGSSAPWRWRWRWPRARNCCCWTNPPPACPRRRRR